MTKVFSKSMNFAGRLLALAMLMGISVGTLCAQTIGGAVFGGGRMADVNGSTLVTVVKCDTISAVYGGNDIAGKVLAGSRGTNNTIDGAEVVIGVSGTGAGALNSTSSIKIGSVYGGGNGYYSYPTIGNAVTTAPLGAGDLKQYNGTGSAIETLTANLYVPQVPRTKITVATQYPYIDSVFGGAKNAFVTATTGNSTEIDITNGTIYSVFGGNNFGGTLGDNSIHAINVSGTTEAANSVNLGGEKGYAYATGSDASHGIRYLFGGGNKVAGQNVVIEVTDGQIDTLFAGGNHEDVLSASVTVNVPASNSLYTTYTPSYDPTTSAYDIRCLFGGNNAAAMTGLPTLTLTSGGIHTVYGGGNQGVMNHNAAADLTSVTGNPVGTSAPNASTLVLINSADIICDTVYGGGQSAGTAANTYIVMMDGHAGTIFGGTNIQGLIPQNYSTNVYVSGGEVHRAVYGGSNGLYRCVTDAYDDAAASNAAFAGNAYSELAGEPSPELYVTNVYISGTALIDSNVYGGGNMALVGRQGTYGSTSVAISGTPQFGIDNDNRSAGIFAGSNFANVYGTARLTITGTPVVYGNIYGGNDKTGTVTGAWSGSGYSDANNYTTTARTDGQDLSDFLNYSALTASATTTTVKVPSAVTITGTPQIHGDVFGGGNGDYNYYHYNDAGEKVAYNTTAMPYISGRREVLKCDNPSLPNVTGTMVDVNIAQTGSIERVFAGGNNATVGEGVTIGSVTYSKLKPYVWVNCDITNSDIVADAHTGNNTNIGTLFGGNNKAAMSVVPSLYLVKGKVGNIYGGGNMGDMTANNEYLGSLPYGVSTYVGLPSDYFVVNGNVYGGCNVADVTKATLVNVKKGTIMGSIFGGNDLSGEVDDAHVILNGEDLVLNGDVFGGGNGDYAFYEQQHNDVDGYYYLKSDGITKVKATDCGVTEALTVGKYCTKDFGVYDMKGRPYVDSTTVILNGDFTINGNIYGGGISGDCRKTRVLVDAPDGEFNGMIFGAGCGRVDNMGLRIGTGCKDLYIGVAQDGDNDGMVDRNGRGEIIYGTAKAMGNVLDTSFLIVHNFKSMGGNRSAMFGGGRSGNVRNTYVQYDTTVESNLKELYLGCLSSDVTNVAYGIINGHQPENFDKITIDTIFGGNDFTGKVQRTELIVNSGNFIHLFGAGNGDYAFTDSIAKWSAAGGRLNDDVAILTNTACNCTDTVPYNMEVEVTINGGVFIGSVYGGGSMGLVGDREMVSANMVATNDTRDEHIGQIVLNIHGGDFHRHIFAGARGEVGMKSRFFSAQNFTNPARSTDNIGKNVFHQPLGHQLAYATKVLNMDSGYVHFSVYGGSEAVDDGFPFECIDSIGRSALENRAANAAWAYTTLRPSSILNITGGRIEKSVYGGGYQGNIYGSVYVNVGIDAVNDSPVWTDDKYGVASHKFGVGQFKPNLVGATNASTTITGNPTLEKKIINFEASVYNASDWGEAGDSAYFMTRGVFGGESNILVDGKGYYTSLTDFTGYDLPSMDIAYSILGAGTSTEGGDCNRLTTNRPYGDYPSCPNPSKSLYSIQRADKVILDSVFLILYGEQDAFSAYASPNYSFCRIDTLIFRKDNIVMIESPSIYVGNMVSMKDNEVYEIANPDHLYLNVDVTNPEGSDTPNDFFDNLKGHPSSGNSADCDQSICENTDICAKLPEERGKSGSVANYNVLMLRNGSYVRVSPFVDKLDNMDVTRERRDGLDDPDHDFGHVYGWMYLLAQDQTLSYVYAEEKYTSNNINVSDGGFVAPCWCDNFGTYDNEIDYTNVVVPGDADYRSWKVGTRQGSRVRRVTLVANATPDGILNHDLLPENETSHSYPRHITGESGTNGTITVNAADDLAYATAYVELPPSDGGNFYLVRSIVIDRDNGGQLSLIDQGYNASDSTFVQFGEDPVTAELAQIQVDSNYSFGLTFSSGDNFSNGTCWNSGSSLTSISVPSEDFNVSLVDAEHGNTRYNCWPQSVIPGSQYITMSGGYISNAIIPTAVGVIPTMNFTLTYSKNISTTISRDVEFTLYEFDQNGNFIGPIEITITISTVIKEFSDQKVPVLAMYNEGVSNTYVRKVTIPASFNQRDIYLHGISWIKDTNVVDAGYTVNDNPNKKNWFHLQDFDDEIDNNNHFALTVEPTESTSEELNNTLGWYHIEKRFFDVYELAKQDYEESTGLSFRPDNDHSGTDSTYNSLDYNAAHDKTNLGQGAGLWLGTLDGRSTASMDVTLKFNGDHFYHNQFNPPLANVKLTFYYKNTKTSGDGYFDLVVQLRTRREGDTIYLAPKPTLTRIAQSPDGGTLPITMHAYGFGYDSTHNYYAGHEGNPNWVPADDATPSYANLIAEASTVRNNPNNYLMSITQAMRIYQEGDVLDILDSMPISTTRESVSIIGDDYSVIQMIRYSGSHFKFPTMACANPNPMIVVRGSGNITLRNVWINGSGCTRKKQDTTFATPGATYEAGRRYTKVGNHYYYENFRRSDVVHFSSAPAFYCHGSGTVHLTSNVRISNNFNKEWNSDPSNDAVNTNFIGGGAIAIKRLPGETGSRPRVSLGDKIKIYDNAVIDWNAATAATSSTGVGTSDSLPRNYGGAVYVDGGELVLGSGLPQQDINVSRNFYLKADANNIPAAFKEKIAYIFTNADETETGEMKFRVYYLDTMQLAKSFSLSNVYLKRSPAIVPDAVRRDLQSDLVYFLSTMKEGSKVGISKWFPGYRYSNSRTTGTHKLDNTIPRDTIAFARIAQGKSSTTLVDEVYNSNVFFNDSAYYSYDGPRANAADSLNPSFSDRYPSVTYTTNATAYPNYNDKVFIFHHASVGPYNIYFQRCASFAKGIRQVLDEEANTAHNIKINKYQEGDSISFHWNPTATCVVSTDTVFFHVGGGFFPYKYHWDSDTIVGNYPNLTVNSTPIRDRRTVGSNAISNMDNPEVEPDRLKAQMDTLVLTDLRVRQDYLRSTYLYKVTATDLTGNCSVTQPVMIRVGKITDEGRGEGQTYHAGTYYVDSLNFLCHRNPYLAYSDYNATYGHDGADGNINTPAYGSVSNYKYYRIPAPGVDSSSFHDYVRYEDNRDDMNPLNIRFLNEAGNEVPWSYDGDPTHSLTWAGATDENLFPVEHQFRVHMLEEASSTQTANGGVRRAGYSNHLHHNYNIGINDGTEAQKVDAWTYQGRPYIDKESAILNRVAGTIYESEMVPRYLRVYRSYKVDPQIYPVAARGVVKAFAHDETEFTPEHALDLKNDEFCPGSIIQLHPSPDSVHSDPSDPSSPMVSHWEYIAWSFDPSSPENASFVVSLDTNYNKPAVYYSPTEYWWQAVTSYNGQSSPSSDPSVATDYDYHLGYNGDVTIRTNKGLAWLISTVNGYNGQNAQTFHFNTITLDFTDDPDNTIDMSAYKWSPLGTLNNPFEGTIVGVNADQTVKYITLNENTVPLVGMFGYTNGATIQGFSIDSSLTKGNNYVGGVVARSNNSRLSDLTIKQQVIFGEYITGGIVAKGDGTSVSNVDINSIRMRGNSLYAGGIFGYGSVDTVSNTVGEIDTRNLSSIYFGGVMGSSTDPATSDGGGKKRGNKDNTGRTQINNNYMRINGGSNNQKVGGLIGSAKALDMNNNYVYGESKARDYVGGIAGYVGQDVSISNCYYVSGMTDDMVGYSLYGGNPAQKSTTFHGSGNQVLLTERVDGYTNLTRVLNAWVNAHPESNYFHWRSDLENVNSGYPIFGDPDMIPVNDTLITSACESYEFDGITFDQSGTYIFHVVDSSAYLDSTFYLMLTVNYGDTTTLFDSIDLGQGYDGMGYHFSDADIRAGIAGQGQQQIYTFQYVDSLYSVNGCDSLVVLTLYVVNNNNDIPQVVNQLSDVKVYPNPTLSIVNVEGSDLQSIEVYDAVSRPVLKQTLDSDKTVVDLSDHPTGSYYFRIRTATGTVVKKVIKK